MGEDRKRRESAEEKEKRERERRSKKYVRRDLEATTLLIRMVRNKVIPRKEGNCK